MNDLGEIAGPRFDALWENGPIGAFVADSDGKWLAVNRRWTEITGISEEQALSDDGLLDLVHPEDSAALHAGWEQVISTGEQGQTSFRLLHEERGTRHLLATVVGLTGEDGQRTGILGTVSDETDRRVAEAALRSSEELHRLTIKNLPDSAVGLYDLDMRCLIMEGIEARGMTSESLRGKPIEEFCPPEVMESLQPGIDAALAGGEYQGEYAVSALNERWGFHTAPFVDESGLITGVMIVAQNITEQRKAEQETRRVEGMFRVAFDRAPIGMAIVGMDERFDRVNRSLEEMVGTTDERLRSGSVFDIVEPQDTGLARAVFARVVESGESGGEMRLVRADGRKLWVDVHATLVTDEDGMPLHILVQVQDVTDRHELIGRLEHMVIHDPLTNLLNRRGLETALAAQIAVNRRYGERGCLMILDLDNFKQVNDAAGHAVGDELIVATADALRTRLRDSDVIARLGGDEFAVILPEQDLQEAQQVARDVIAEIGARGQEVGPGLGAVTASIGLTALCSVGMTPGDALIRADHAMYKSKRAGKNRVAPYDETSMSTGMPTGSSARTELPSSS